MRSSLFAALACWTPFVAACGGADAAAAGSGGSSTSQAASSVTASSSSSTSSAASSSSGAGGAGGAPQACDPTVPRTVPLDLYVEPDSLVAPFTAELDKAKTSIRVMVYEMGFGGILDALLVKAKAGVAVRVMLDKAQIGINQKYFDMLTAAGAKVEWSDPQFTYMHAKFLVVDGDVAVISTGNYSVAQMKKERNYVVRDADPADVATLVALFDADYERKTPDLQCTRLVVSPVNSRARILDVIASAKTTLDIESMQLADTDVRAAMAARKAAGVAVRVILDDASFVAANTQAAAFLTANQIPVKWMMGLQTHVKAIAVDGQRAYVGSENLSYTSLSKNREVGVVAFEPAILKTMGDTFEKDWAAGTDF